MFPINSENEKEGGLLRSGRKFRLRKRRRTATRIGICGMNERRDYELAPHLNRESWIEEEEYRIISEEKEEAPNLKQYYDIPTTLRASLTYKVRPKSVSKCDFSNHSNSNSQDSS